VFGADPLRFWCARATSFGHDGNVSIDGLHERYERELGNDLGNLLSRTTAMIARYRGGTLRVAPSESSPVKALLDPLAAAVAAQFDVYDITGALERIWEVVRGLNRHVEATAPWQLAKDEARAHELDAVLYDLADGLRVVAVALAPYLPSTTPAILGALHQSPDLAWSGVAYGATTEAAGIEPAPPLFPRIDTPQAA
jgi:methionyl-tRNA synthetase